MNDEINEWNYFFNTLHHIKSHHKTLNAQRITKRDFLDPDFRIKGSLNLASRKRSKCRVNTEADSEIPELGLDSARVNLYCDINPTRVADAAVRMARTYGKYRRNRHQYRQGPAKSSASTKRKRTRISIERDYEKSRHPTNSQIEPQDADQDDDDYWIDLIDWCKYIINL